MSTKQANQYLADAYARATSGNSVSIDPEMQRYLDILTEHREKNKGVLAMTVTLLLKKTMTPKQDIRYHQAGLPGGFSARGLDSGAVTPFLREKNFPHMASGAGALTRSLEQAAPYDKNYIGKITPQRVKDAFLSCVDLVQVGQSNASDVLVYLLAKLIEYRDRDESIKLHKPVNVPIKEMVEKIRKHFDKCGGGGSVLPVLAIYAVYKRLVEEAQRYKGYVLCDLQSHTAADRRSGFLGDVQVNGPDGKPFEVVEIKHNIKLSAELVRGCYDKFKSAPVKTYYLLSTNESLKDPEKISEEICSIQKNHGCQMIVNGIQTTLRYYLRLLANPDDFLHQYVELLESRGSYTVKMHWQRLWE